MSDTPQRLRNEKGVFVPGHKGIGGRKKGAKNKIAQTVKESLNNVGAKIGFDGEGEGGLEGFLERVGRDDPTFLATAIIRSNVPPATTPEPTDGGGGVNVIQILKVPRGKFFSKEEAEYIEHPENFARPPEYFEQFTEVADLTSDGFDPDHVEVRDNADRLSSIIDLQAVTKTTAEPRLTSPPPHGKPMLRVIDAADDVVVPQTPEEAKLFAELETLSYDELLKRAGLSNVDEG